MEDEAKPTPAAATGDDLSDDDLKQLIEDRLRTAMGASGTQIAKDRIRNLDAYLAEPEGEWSAPEVEDRSSLVATDAADTVEWILPSLLRVFASSRDAIEVTPRRPQFQQQAELVKETLKWVFWDRMDGLTFLHDWFKDGLTSKVGFARVGYCDSKLTVSEPYRGLTDGQVQALLSEEGVTVTGHAARIEQTDQGQIQMHDLDIERSESDGYPVVHAVPPEEMRIDNAARYGSEPAFIAQEYTRSRSDLLAEGYPVEALGSQYDRGMVNEESQARRRINSSFLFDDDDSDDPQLRVVDAYVRRGSPSDAKWIRGLIIGDTLVERTETDAHPFVWWCPAPMPHVFFGHCPVDQAIEPQRLRTRLLRAVEDNVYLSVNGRTGVVGGDENTIDDLLDSRPGGVVRLKSKDDLVPIIQPDLSAAAWQAVEWAEQWTEKRTGFSRLSKGLSSEAINDTATGVMEITERADMRVELISRHAAAALSKVLAKVMRVMGRHQDVSQTIRINGQWVDVDPRQWDTMYQVVVRVGLGTANKDRQTAQLGQLMDVQQGLSQGGVVPPVAAIALARRLAESMGLERAEQFFPDPPPPNPNQPPPLPVLIEQMKGQQRAAETQLQAQAKLQEVQANLQLQASNDARDSERAQLQAALDAQLQRADQENKRFIAEMQAANDRYRTELEQQTKLQIAAMQAQAAQVPALDLSGLQRMESALLALHEAVNSPKVVVRDPATNRVIGVDRANRQ